MSLSTRHHIKCFPSRFWVAALLLVLFSCDDPSRPGPQLADCPPGQLPCPADSTICCAVDCPPGYHLGGPDSTDCLPDTSSHAMTWRVDTLGYNGLMFDVAIISEDDIWAVGEFYRHDGVDTTNHSGTRYNAAHWDGERWEPIRIPVPYSFGGGTAPLTLSSLAAFASDNIYFASGAALIHWDGQRFNQKEYFWDFPDPEYGPIRHIWGSSPDTIYSVGYKGWIIEYTGNSWRRMTTGTDVTLEDVWGTGPGEVWASGEIYDEGLRSAVLRLEKEEWVVIYEQFYDMNTSLGDTFLYMYPPYPPVAFTIWTTKYIGGLIFGSGNGMWQLDNKYDPTTYEHLETINRSPELCHVYRVRGYTETDFFMACSQRLVHYNGVDLFSYPDLEGGNWYSLDIKGNTIAVTGEMSGVGVFRAPSVAIGRRH